MVREFTETGSVTRRQALVRGTLSLGMVVGLAGCRSGGDDSGTDDELAQLRERNEELESRVEKLESKLTARDEEIAQLETEIETERQALTDLEATLESKNATIVDLESQLETRRERIDELEAELERRQERLDELEADLEAKAASLSELEAELDSCRERIENLERQLESNDAGGESEFTESVRQQASQVGETLESSVVYLYKELETGTTTGTGWFYDEGLVVSNGHVINARAVDREMYDKMTAFLADGTSFTVEPVAKEHGFIDGNHVDVGLLETSHEGTPVTRGDESTLTADQPLVQNGHPSDVGEWVTSLGRFVGFRQFHGMTTTVPTRSGNSGSPVATLDGEVVGLTMSTVSEGPDTGEADQPEPADDTVYTERGYRDTVEELTAHTPISYVEEFVAENR